MNGIDLEDPNIQKLIDRLVDSRFNDIDKDNSGSIEFREFLTNIKEYMKSLSIEISDSTIENHMNSFDTNNDGKLTKEEFKSYFIKTLKGEL
jgi:Ca2+-binding EF-hand superfamily protein